MSAKASSHMVAILVDDRGLIPVLYEKEWEPATGGTNYLINPYTFRDNFMLTPEDCISHDVVGKWEYYPEMTKRVFHKSIIEARQPINRFRLRKEMGMEMGEVKGMIFCYMNRELYGKALDLDFGRFGYIFLVEKHIITDIEEMGIVHEVMGKY